MCSIRWTESYPNNNLDWKDVPISVSISSKLIDEPIFIYNKDPQKLSIDFVIKLELLAEKSKLEMRTKFQDVERVVNERMSKIFQELNARCRNLPTENFEYEDECIEDTEETDMSTQFLRMQKNQLIDLKQNLERYVNTLPVFGFNSGRYDLNLIKSYLIPYLINDKEAEPMVIKKANDFISFKFGDIQFLDIMKFLGGATSLDSFLKAYKAGETKGFSLMSGLTVQTSSRVKNYLHTKPFSVNWETTNLLIKTLRITRTSSQVVDLISSKH